ncbi:hypothetical protein FRB90_004792 [Tulasnella sp. 427]|nr:hypothetical protein FRB90_004792 [Tulasnella sp. 427]
MEQHPKAQAVPLQGGNEDHRIAPLDVIARDRARAQRHAELRKEAETKGDDVKKTESTAAPLEPFDINKPKH